MSKVAVIDYGASNLLNVVRALDHCGGKVDIADTIDKIAEAERLVFPGVGAFSTCMQVLKNRGLMQPLIEYIQSDQPFLGICMGMQVMFESSEEFGEHAGLKLLKGRVVRVPDTGTGGRPHKIPHIGWSALQKPPGQSWQGTILEGLESLKDKATVYFVHSYMGMPLEEQYRLANIDYNGIPICAAIRRGNAYGVQFHPEKSGEAGLTVLRNFLSL